MKKDDIFFLKQALNLAKKGEGNVFPNPLVGCVLVKNHRIIAEGYHKKFGGPHAEIEALKSAGKNAKDSIMYINLEPCCHYGKTPPCVDEIIKNKINQIYISIIDPNPLVNGKGIEKLKKAGIKVHLGLLSSQAIELNRAYLKAIKDNRPFVIVKAALSLDGKIATKTGDSKWISNEKSRDFVQILRSESDAVLVGVNTIIKDDPLLTIHSLPQTKTTRVNPKKIVLDSQLRIPLNSKILQDKSSDLIIVTSENEEKDLVKISVLQAKGAKILFSPSENKKIFLKQLLKKLVEEEKIGSLLVEGGGEVISSFLKEEVVDRIYFFYAPIIIGGKDAPTPVEGEGVEDINSAIKVKNIKIKEIDDNFLIIGEIKDVYGNY